MQAFREKYHVHDTAEEGRRVIGRLTEEHPGFLLAIIYLEADQSYISILDLEAFVSSHMNNAEQFRTFIVALYYILQYNQNHFRAIRTGTSVMAECLGVDSDTFDGDFLTTTMQELYLPYPQRNKDIYLLNCPGVINAFLALWKRHLPANIKKALRVGCQIRGLEGFKIDLFYKLPTPEIVRLTLLTEASKLLETRYDYRSRFRLPP